MKKILSLITLLTLGTLITSCGLKSSDGTLGTDDSVIVDSSVQEQVEVAQVKTLAYQAATGLKMASSIQPKSVLKARNDSTKELTQEDIDKIQTLLPSIDMINSSSSFTNTIENSDLDGYELKHSISFSIFDNEQEEMTLYYNITSENTEQETDEDEDGVEEEVTITKTYSGIALYQDSEYEFIGREESETETEDGETEEENELTMTLTVSEGNYIVIKHEVEKETDENSEEFKYSVYTDNKLTYSYSFEIENDIKDGVEHEVKLLLNDVYYKFETEVRDNVTYIEVKISGETTTKATFTRSIVTDETTGVSTVVYELVK